MVSTTQETALTVARNCDSGMDAIVNAWRAIQVGDGVVEDCRVFVPALMKTLKSIEAYAGRATHVI